MRVKIEVNQFAKIDEAAVYLDEFLLFVGDNNSGKTLLMELIYGIVKLICEWNADSSKAKTTERPGMKQYSFARQWFKDTEDRINLYFRDYKDKFIMDIFKYKISLGSIAIKFEDYEDLFYIGTIASKASLEKQYPDGEREFIFENFQTTDDMLEIFMHWVLNDIVGMHDEKQLFVPAARAGLQMLYRYLFVETTSANAGLPLPVAEYLNFIQTYTQNMDLGSEEKDLVEYIEEQLLRGKVDYENGQFIFREKDMTIPLNYASSMIHELSILPYVLKSSQKVEAIYYDEIENSVHPLLQGIVARSLIRFCNMGMRLVVSTHSDTMAGKLNNLVLLARMKNIAERNKKLEKLGLTIKDMLDDSKKIMVYEFIKSDEGKVKVQALEFMSYPKIGYAFDRFNENIDQLYDESNVIMEDV